MIASILMYSIDFVVMVSGSCTVWYMLSYQSKRLTSIFISWDSASDVCVKCLISCLKNGTSYISTFTYHWDFLTALPSLLKNVPSVVEVKYYTVQYFTIVYPFLQKR